MDQQATIKLLNSIMPEIAETRNPEAAMLKCAKEHKLTPAMLEKLGHVFNTSKTLVGLEKMANRGDSFTIVDVPAMVQNYTTYDPAAPLSREDKKVHKTVNQITKYAGEADMWRALIAEKPITKAAGVNDWIYENKVNEPGKLPHMDDLLNECINNYGGGFEYTNGLTDSEWQQVCITPTPADILHKAASAEYVQYTDEEFKMLSKEARHAFEDVTSEAGSVKFEKFAAIHNYISWDTARWKEIAEDAITLMDKSAAAAMIKEAEEYFAFKGLNVEPVEFEKLACRTLPRDRHHMASNLAEAWEATQVIKEAKLHLESLEKSAESRKQTYSPDITNSLLEGMSAPMAKEAGPKSGLLDALGKLNVGSMVTGSMDAGKNAWEGVRTVVDTMGDGKNSKQKVVDDALAQAAKDATLQRLMLTDPIIREADPYEVQDIYHAIADLSPNLAKSPMLMSTLIKEQLQYGALPIQTTKDIANVEKTITDIEAAKQRLNGEKYDK